jgi:hypothetical protein
MLLQLLPQVLQGWLEEPAMSYLEILSSACFVIAKLIWGIQSHSRPAISVEANVVSADSANAGAQV